MGKKFDFDFIVIGSGVAGEIAATYAAQSGLKVAIVEHDKWGGSNANYRDVPYRAALNFSHLYTQSLRGSRFGISSSTLRYNYPTVLNWQSVAMRRADGDNKKNLESAGVTCIKGFANFLSRTEISVGTKQISAPKFLVTTGAIFDGGSIAGLDYVDHYTPENAINISRPPRTVVVVGAGATGCEIAQYYAELGAKVLMLELAGRILPHEDLEVGEAMEQYFREQLRIKVLTESRVIALEKDKLSKRVVFLRGGQEKAVRIDTIILATGSKPALDVGLENAGVQFDKNGIKVNKFLQTTSKNIWAAGDVIGGNSSSERAKYEAVLAVSNLHKNKNAVEDRKFVRLTYSYPQIATIAATEDDCIKHDYRFSKAFVPLSAITASNTFDFRFGFLKLLADKQGKILGATAMCPNAELVIQEIALAIDNDLTVEDLASTPRVSSSWSDLVRLAAIKLR